MSQAKLTREIKEFALDLGYSKVGITTADDFTEYVDDLRSRGAYYDFFANDPRDPLRCAKIREVAPSARSIVVVVWDYMQKAFPDALLDRVGRVYQARCYIEPPHRINGARLQLMKNFLQEKGCGLCGDFIVPDRWAAARAGVASFGRNNFAYADGVGSFIIISSIVIDRELEYDAPTTECKCPPGCSACMDACPTKAIYEPFRLDPRRCLAFNAWKTTETQGYGITSYIPRDIRENMGQRVHGCDVCQEVCPRNAARLKERVPADPFLEEIAKDFSLARMLRLSDEFYETRVHPIMYNYIRDRQYFRRNAAVALGNTGDESCVPDLAEGMNDSEEVVRAHVAWALGKIGGKNAEAILERSLSVEVSEKVREEIGLALARARG